MSVLGAQQTGQDGTGQEKTLYGLGIRLKAKALTTTRYTTLKITGMSSGAVWYVDLLVRNGDGPRFSPPSMTPPGGPPPGGRPPGGPPPGGPPPGGREEERGRREEERGGREEERGGREEERRPSR